MSIRNAEKIIRVFSEHEYGTSYPYMEFEEYFKDHEYWCIAFNNSDQLPIVERCIPNDILNEIRTGELHLLLSNVMEALSDNIPHIYDMLDRLAIPIEKVTVTSAAFDFDVELEKYTKLYNRKPFALVRFNICELIQQVRLSERVEKPVPTKRFISANHRWRIHRPLIIASLIARDLLKHGYVSMRKADDNLDWESCYNDMVAKLPSLSAHKDVILNLPELYIDDVEFDVGYPDELPRIWYDQSCFALVNETSFFHDENICLSEKTFKCIDYEIPFIIAARPKTLALLRRNGYKTFSPYINEDYDNEPDDIKRLLMIVEEVERLCKLSDEQMDDLLNKIRPICYHNRQVLTSLQYPNDFVYPEWYVL